MSDFNSDQDVLDRIFEKLLNHKGALGLTYLLSIIAPESGTAQVKYYKSILDTSPLISKKQGYGDDEFNYTLSPIGIKKMIEFGNYNAIQNEVPKINTFRMPRNSKFADDPGTELERLNIILKALNEEPLSMWNTVATLVSSVLRWNRLSQTELNELEKTIIDSEMVDYEIRPGQYRHHFKLSQSGRKIIKEHGSYLKYIKPQIDHKTRMSYYDIFTNWISREKKFGVTYPMEEIQAFWKSTNIEYDLEDGTYLRWLNMIAKTPLLIIDDFGLQPLSHDMRLTLLQILEDRFAKGSTIVTSQLPVNKWYEYLKEPTLADAICD